MKGNNLTPKQERFTQYIFEGYSQIESWRKAGYSTNYDRAVIDTNASMLANQNKIKIRLAELRSQVTDVNVMTVQKRRERLSELAEKEPHVQNPLQAIDLLNKMDKIYSESGNTYNDIKVLIVREAPQSKSEGLNEGTNGNV